MIAETTRKHQKTAPSPLDLFSISETNAFSVETYATDFSLKCVNNAPYFAYAIGDGKGYAITQGNCHSWSCPKCGIGRAKQEYGRIVEGCRTLEETNKLYFMTITCRGKNLSFEQSEAGYLTWTHRLITTLRKNAKKRSLFWAYVQVTERQARGHPHSHFLTTYHPADLHEGTKQTWRNVNGGHVSIDVPAMRSDYIQERVISAGLGDQYDISEVRSAEAASRYVAKYMFKDTMFSTSWPKKWRRVRYSRSFPKMDKKTSDAMVLIKMQDWRDLAQKASVLIPDDLYVYQAAMARLDTTPIKIRKPKS